MTIFLKKEETIQLLPTHSESMQNHFGIASY